MANARTRFDTIREYMARSHDATNGQLYGKPCSMFRGRAFIAFHLDGMAFKMRGRMRLQALAMPDAHFWDPLLPDRPDPDWVWVPPAHVLRWDRLAVEAYRQQRDQGDLAVARPLRAADPAARSAPDPASIGSTPMPAASGQLTARPLPSWAERLRQLTGWTRWTTSRLDE